ncbi:MAG: LexA family transcriptional regulator [Desulfohalobiaceae bacterium]
MDEQSFQAFFERLKSVSFIQNQSQLAHFLQVGRASVSLAKHKNQVPNRWIVTLASELNLNADWLARGRGTAYLEPQSGESRPARIRRVEPQLDTNGEFRAADPQDPQSLQLDAHILDGLGNAEQMVALAIREEGMHPEIRSGDLVLLDQSVQAVQPTRIHALGIGGGVVLRRLDRLPHGTVIYADNPSYPSSVVKNEEWQSVRLLGRVVFVCRRT